MTSATRNRFVALTIMVIALVGLLLYTALSTNAQTVTASASPNTVNATKPESVKLQIVNQDGSANSDLLGQVKKVQVGDQSVTTTRDAQGSVTFTPPANLAGTQTFQLFGDKDPVKDAGGNALSVQLNYALPNALASPTPDMAWIEKFNSEIRRNNLVNRGWYYPFIIFVFLAVCGAFVFAITRGILRSRATFRTPTGLPVGSFRAILAYTLVLFLGFYVLISLLVVSNFPPPEFLLGIVATVVGFYFGSRTGDEGGIDTRVGTVRGIVRRGPNPVAGALVKFKNLGDNTEPYSRITDVDGRFSVNTVKPAKYKVIAEIKTPPGAGDQDVTVSEGSDQEIQITIAAAAGGGGAGAGAGGGAGEGGGAGGGGAGGN